MVVSPSLSLPLSLLNVDTARPVAPAEISQNVEEDLTLLAQRDAGQ